MSPLAYPCRSSHACKRGPRWAGMAFLVFVGPAPDPLSQMTRPNEGPHRDIGLVMKGAQINPLPCPPLPACRSTTFQCSGQQVQVVGLAMMGAQFNASGPAPSVSQNTETFYPADFNCETVTNVVNSASAPGLYSSNGDLAPLSVWNWQSSSSNQFDSYYPP